MLDTHQVQYLAQEIACSIGGAIKAGLGEQPTLRDRFAMAALQGMIASGNAFRVNNVSDESDARLNREKQASSAYLLADAMMAARDAKPAAAAVEPSNP